MNFVIDALSVFRLTRLVTKDAITDGLRLRVHRAVMTADVSNPVAEKAQTLLSCPWCVSWWVAILVVTARRLCPRLWEPVGAALAASAVTGLVAENLD